MNMRLTIISNYRVNRGLSCQHARAYIHLGGDPQTDGTLAFTNIRSIPSQYRFQLPRNMHMQS